MPAALLGRKLGMTRFIKDDGTNIPVTVILCGPCAVTQVKTTETDGYAAVQIAFEDIKPRNSTFPEIGHDAKAGVTPKRFHRELRLADDKAIGDYQAGQTIDVKVFESVMFVDVTGTSKGKGFQGVMKRHNFKGLRTSHGVKKGSRQRGSIASNASGASGVVAL